MYLFQIKNLLSFQKAYPVNEIFLSAISSSLTLEILFFGFIKGDSGLVLCFGLPTLSKALFELSDL